MKLIQSENDIYIQETEVKPNGYACIVLTLCVFTVIFCELLAEVGIFRVGLKEIRVGSVITFLSSAVPLFLLLFSKSARSHKATKYFILSACGIFTFSVGIFLTFHTTILLLFPILFAMLYRSKPIGILASVFSLSATVITPIFGYLLGTWDVPLFQELILIATNGNAVIEGAHEGVSLLNVGKVLLYIVLPRLLMVGSCTVLLFYVIRISVAHVDNQILLNKISRRDSVTGLFNRFCLEEILKAAETAVQNRDMNFAVLFFDVNDLKVANDSRGHEYGNLLLERCADTLLRVTDELNSYAFRVGGDEFAILLVDCDEAGALKKISEWKAILRGANIKYAHEDPDGVPCSMAVGHAVGKYPDIEELLKLSDSRMYEAKAEMKKSRLA